jgi:hypothetical protein
MTTIATEPPSRNDLDREYAANDAVCALRGVAVNILRIIAGGGEPLDLYPQMLKAITKLAEYDKLNGGGPRGFNVWEGLDPANPDTKEYDLICKGAPRLTAHNLLGTAPAYGGKNSADLIRRGIADLMNPTAGQTLERGPR